MACGSKPGFGFQHMSNPIATRNRPEFLAYMSEIEVTCPTHTLMEWWLLDMAEEFMIKKKYSRGDPQSAVNYYLKEKTA